jgi:hypothetical protein
MAPQRATTTANTSRSAGCTPVYLRYNSGLHTSVNGRELALMLERLVAAWPVPLQRITGGPQHGRAGGALGGAGGAGAWACAGRGWLQDLVFLGTPHHGAPLERAGHGVDCCWPPRRSRRPLPGWASCAAPASPTCGTAMCMAPTGGAATASRSAADHRLPLPLPEGVACCTPWRPRWPASAACWPTG